MYITTSKNPSLLEKRLSKYFCIVFNLNYLPRGKTSLKKLFSKGLYHNYKNFIIIKKNIDSKISIYFYYKKQKQYFIQRIYDIEILDIRNLIGFKYLKKQNNNIFDPKYFFYIFNSNKNSNLKLREEFENIFKLYLKKIYTGLKIKLLEVRRFD